MVRPALHVKITHSKLYRPCFSGLEHFCGSRYDTGMSRSHKQHITVARSLAVEVLRKIEAEGAYSSLVLRHALEKANHLSTSDRKLVTELVYGTLRWRMKLDYALQLCCHRPLQKIEPVLLRILRISAYQLLFLDRIPDWAVVDQAGRLGTTMRGKAAGGFLNGVLRKLAASKDNLAWPNAYEQSIMDMSVSHSFPTWLVSDWAKQFGPERSAELMQAFNQTPALWIRTNTCWTNTHKLMKTLETSGYSTNTSDILPDALMVETDGNVGRMMLGNQNEFHIQDGAAQAVCALADPQAGQRVLDCCSAPGGKTATLAQLMGNQGHILSVDIHPGRLKLAKQLAERLHLDCIEIKTHDLTKTIPPDWGKFDVVLLDAPCSSLGTIRRHPERKWNASKENISELVCLQKALLDSICFALKPNGVLVYSVCTPTPEEGPDLIQNWLAEHPEFDCEDPRRDKTQSWHRLLNHEGALQTWPDRDDMDAFYAVRLVKRN